MRKLISLFIFTLMIILSSQSVFAATFSDVQGKNCETAVNFLSDRGIVAGYADGTFHPSTPVTRAELCKLIVVANDLKEIDSSKINLTDILGHWAKAYIGISTQHQIVKGYPDGTFKPQSNVTYPELMAVLIGALNKQDQLNPGVSWPNNYVDLGKAIGLDSGMSITNWNAQASRGDVAIAIYNSMQLNNVKVSLIDAEAKTYRTDTNNNKVYTTEFYKNGNDKVQIELNLEYNSLEADANVPLTSKMTAGTVTFKTGSHSILLKKGTSKSTVNIELSLAGMDKLYNNDYTIKIYSNQSEIASCIIKIATDYSYEKSIVERAIVKDLRFFNSTEVPSKSDRLYGTEFSPSNAALTIWWDLEAQFPIVNDYMYMPVSFKYYKAGVIWAEHKFDTYLYPNQSTPDIVGGIYTNSSVIWSNGEYSVQVYIFDRLMAEKNFTIVGN